MIRIRKCLICGKRIRIKVDKKGKYDKGHYFGDLKLPIDGTGRWKKVGRAKLGRHSYDVVDWTGKKKEIEYWECNECFEKAGHSVWLEEMIEKLYGKRCKDYEGGCACCQAWDVYDTIRDELKSEL